MQLSRTWHFCDAAINNNYVIHIVKVAAQLLLNSTRRSKLVCSNQVNAALKSLTREVYFTLRPLPPLFPVSTWNIGLHVATLNDDDKTNNQCEAWNRGFAALVGHNFMRPRRVQGVPKNWLNLFLSELRQISTKIDNFWHADSQDDRNM